jgi:hypothetical protein
MLDELSLKSLRLFCLEFADVLYGVSRTISPRHSGGRAPVLGQKLVGSAHRMTVGHALKDILEIGEGPDIVELGAGDERANGRPAFGAAVRSGEQVVLAAERDGTDCSLDGVIIKVDAAIEEAAEDVPAA